MSMIDGYIEGHKVNLCFGPCVWKRLRDCGLAKFTDEQFNKAMDTFGHIGEIEVSIYGYVDAYIERPFPTLS